jgi:hypothetical protein
MSHVRFVNSAAAVFSDVLTKPGSLPFRHTAHSLSKHPPVVIVGLPERGKQEYFANLIGAFGIAIFPEQAADRM